MTEPLDDARGELLALADRFANAPIWQDDDDPEGFLAVDISPVQRDQIVTILRAAPARCDAESNELAEWKQAASVEAGLRREFLARAERQKIVLDWIESWVSNPVGAYSVSALDGLFGMTRDKIAALSPDPGTVAVASAQYRCTCGAEPYCAPNVHDTSCPLAVTSAERCTMCGGTGKHRAGCINDYSLSSTHQGAARD